MIKKEKSYTEEFAVQAFNEYMKATVEEECQEYLNFTPDFSDLNEIVLGKFLYKEEECCIKMDAINCEITITAGDKKSVDNFAGLTDHCFFNIGDDGITDESEYADVFTQIYDHMIYGMGPWILEAISMVDGTELQYVPIPYDKIQVLN